MVDHIANILKDFDAEFGLESDPDLANLGSTKNSPPSFRSASPPRGQEPEIDSRTPAEARANVIRSPHANTQGIREERGMPESPPEGKVTASTEGAMHEVTVDQALRLIDELRKGRIQDAENLREVQTENARLTAKLAVLEHTDLKVAELGARLEQLLRKYLETEQIRTKQVSQISELRQEIIVLKSRMAGRG
jgi:hypothetical protein